MVVNSLAAVDLVAAIVEDDARDGVAAAVRRELDARESVRIVELGGSALALTPAGSARDERDSRSDVYLWDDADAAIQQDPDGFERAVDRLCSSIASATSIPRGERAVRRAVLIGGNVLLGRLDRLVDYLRGSGRYRYVLVR